MILVTGATGNVGRQVVAELRRAGVEVRALTRNPERADFPTEVDVTRGDQYDPDSLHTAVKGVDAVFLMWPFLQHTSAAASAPLAAIRQHEPRVVFLSSLAVRDDVEQQRDANAQFHADVERQIEESGLEWTFLRSAGIATNTLAWAPQIRATGVVRGPYRTAARSLIHERDIAALAARALTGDAHGGKRYALTGPQSIAQVEQLDAIGAAIGRPLKWEEISPATAREQMLAQFPAELVDGILHSAAGFVTRPEPVTTTVQDVTGVPARTFAQWAVDHADDFR
jgi:uncharacterized protein YbjT (DUF2867 family)